MGKKAKVIKPKLSGIKVPIIFDCPICIIEGRSTIQTVTFNKKEGTMDCTQHGVLYKTQISNHPLFDPIDAYYEWMEKMIKHMKDCKKKICEECFIYQKSTLEKPKIFQRVQKKVKLTKICLEEKSQ